MKLIFEGAPEQIFREVKEYIARAAIEFGDQEDRPEVITEPVITKKEEDLDTTAAPIEKKPEAQMTSEEPVCRFCAKYSNASVKRLGGHEKHCKQNPNRIPHPKEGKPMNPGMRKWMIEKGYMKSEAKS